MSAPAGVASNAVRDGSVGAQFAPLLAEIGAGAVRREADRELPFAVVDRLRAAGFGAVRLPVEQGGHGASFTELVDLLIELGRADANLPQLLRGHVAFVELLLSEPDWLPQAARDTWLARIADGTLVGNAQSEQGGGPLWEPSTTIVPDGAGWLVDGRKYYSTGTLFADWVYVSGRDGDGQDVVALVPTDHSGVERHDDWDGFGQRLTGSGTTVFHAVPAADGAIRALTAPSSQAAVFQLVLLATLAGIAQRALDDVLDLVRGRRRAAFTALVPAPREDPQVQQRVGEIAGRVLAATSTVRAAAAQVEQAQGLERRGAGDDETRAVADTAVFTAQPVVVELVLGVVTDLFGVGGASATSRSLALDRHWRNARTVASHNPEMFRARIVGDRLLNGTPPAAAAARPDRGTPSAERLEGDL